MAKTVEIRARIPEQVYQRLTQYAASRGVSLSSVISVAAFDHAEKLKLPPPAVTPVTPEKKITKPRGPEAWVAPVDDPPGFVDVFYRDDVPEERRKFIKSYYINMDELPPETLT